MEEAIRLSRNVAERAYQTQTGSQGKKTMHASPSESAKKFKQLFTEKLRKAGPRSGSPLSRKEELEQQALRECSFRPGINKVSKILAMRRVGKKRVADVLYQDAIDRRAKQDRATKEVLNGLILIGDKAGSGGYEYDEVMQTQRDERQEQAQKRN